MTGFWNALSGMYEVELTTGAPEDRLWEINGHGICVFCVLRISDICLRFRVRRKDYQKLSAICEIRGDSLVIRRQMGLTRYLSAAGRRPVLLLGIFILVLLTWILPTRILIFRVEGNTIVPTNRILETAAHCGLEFGCQRSSLRSEQLKNDLLMGIPELKWAGINTYGCVAVISVREDAESQPNPSPHGVSNIVALRDGVVLSCSATKGNLLCRPGMAVRKGQLLISGYTDCGRIIQATDAQGEVYAQTLRSVRVCKLLTRHCREGAGEQIRRFSVIIGKKRINLWKDSGIWDATCGRMYQEYVLTLPGGFSLPVKWCTETLTRYALSDGKDRNEEVSGQLASFSEDYLLQQMNAGRIQSGDYQILQENGIAILEGDYICTEMIGKVQQGQIGEYYGKTDGTNHQR